MNNLCTRIGKFLQRQRAHIRIISSHGYFNMSFSSLLCLLSSTSSAVTSYLGTSIGNLTATDRRMIIIDCLFLLIDHLSYFACQELELVTLLEFPLAFYGSTYQTSSSARRCPILQIHAAAPTYSHISTPTLQYHLCVLTHIDPSPVPISQTFSTEMFSSPSRSQAANLTMSTLFRCNCDLAISNLIIRIFAHAIAITSGKSSPGY